MNIASLPIKVVYWMQWVMSKPFFPTVAQVLYRLLSILTSFQKQGLPKAFDDIWFKHVSEF